MDEGRETEVVVEEDGFVFDVAGNGPLDLLHGLHQMVGKVIHIEHVPLHLVGFWTVTVAS